MSKLINVPYIKQPKGSAKCGAACAAMVIKHYSGKKVAIDEIWNSISAISPELGREYCRTYKIGAYITSSHFNCVTVKYQNLSELLEFCNANDIAPIINHKSFNDRRGGHFSVIKNISQGNVLINDPENKKRVSVALSELELMAKKESQNDEVGGNTAIIPILDKYETIYRQCGRCNGTINTSFTKAINETFGKMVVEADLCQSCDVFHPVA
ncbi:cysteine peptidase family C39 domain-containing protein [Vibrio parahaemolyticus]